ncbi:unnamed protein product [Rotaria sp. Silwood1]|nr:unnamed protein product [Rotaria sp. Silwood1]CAF1167575.1 unnamed protein product [Rotaria sp. Silwood1]CAF3479134.1 unnamed protein product [Rotaria sp. Silwood1]CAF3486519.1 unnamed protein product [Rotaria sp. Silwood1]CAF4590577.1 unnamed protein product [Rotaria sp. Silwood1]
MSAAVGQNSRHTPNTYRENSSKQYQQNTNERKTINSLDRIGYDAQYRSKPSFLDKYRSNKTSDNSVSKDTNNGNNTQQRTQSYSNNIDTSTLRSTGSVIHDERFGNEILARAGPSQQYQHPQYRTQDVIAPDGRLENLNIQTDNEPLRVVKPADQNIHYKQQVNVRFLEPPPGPEPAPIIIKERQAPAPPPLPPVVVRQRPPTPPTPPPLIIRERPPTPPVQQQPQIIEKVLPAPPAPPRQVIVERLPPPPPKPRQVIYEKWLPYQETKERPVIVERAPPLEVIRPPKNVIIEYEQPKAHHEQIVIDEGVFRADPQSHNATSTMGEVRIVDKITDLPVDYSKYLSSRRPQTVQSQSSPTLYERQSPPPQLSQTEPAQQYRSTNYNYPGAYTTTYRASYTNQNANRSGYGSYGGSDGSRSASYTKYV